MSSNIKISPETLQSKAIEASSLGRHSLTDVVFAVYEVGATLTQIPS
jgi:propanediol dehydratase small subunit